jgi:hypothetical protein|tara:strand:- start:1021 stop:1263 length:243 start_codon:yes stop_codon:yes gene_type:complete
VLPSVVVVVVLGVTTIVSLTAIPSVVVVLVVSVPVAAGVTVGSKEHVPIVVDTTRAPATKLICTFHRAQSDLSFSILFSF